MKPFNAFRFIVNSFEFEFELTKAQALCWNMFAWNILYFLKFFLFK